MVLDFLLTGEIKEFFSNIIIRQGKTTKQKVVAISLKWLVLVGSNNLGLLWKSRLMIASFMFASLLLERGKKYEMER